MRFNMVADPTVRFRGAFRWPRCRLRICQLWYSAPLQIHTTRDSRPRHLWSRACHQLHRTCLPNKSASPSLAEAESPGTNSPGLHDFTTRPDSHDESPKLRRVESRIASLCPSASKPTINCQRTQGDWNLSTSGSDRAPWYKASTWSQRRALDGNAFGPVHPRNVVLFCPRRGANCSWGS